MLEVPRHADQPIRIAVIASAHGSEHAVSLRSAENVRIALQQSFKQVEVFPFDDGLEAALRRYEPDVVFPVAHGIGGESGELQTLLARQHFPFVGSDASSSAVCWDKALTNYRLSDMIADREMSSLDAGALCVPQFIALQRGDDITRAVLEFSDRVRSGAVVVKPACEGSSCGISFWRTPRSTEASKSEVIESINGPLWKRRLDAIVDSVEKTFALASTVMVQEAVAGIEITVGVLEDPIARALPVIEVVTPAGTWYDYAHKYSPGGSEHIIPARLPPATLQMAQRVAVSVHRFLGCRDYTRVDFIVGHSASEPAPLRLWFLEINTLPGFTATSLFPDAALAAGIALPDLVRKLASIAWLRRGEAAGSASPGPGG